MKSLAWSAVVLLAVTGANAPAHSFAQSPAHSFAQSPAQPLAQPLAQPPALANGSEATARSTPLAEPEAAEAIPPKVETRGEARIEQRRQGAHVIEIVVTPAGRTYSYSMQNREGQRPLSPQDLGSGLSTPRFLKFEF